jgi:hypothetical protein
MTIPSTHHSGCEPRVYADVAGSASHAQHMPPHILFALEMWDDAVVANQRSVAVAYERVKRKGLGPERAITIPCCGWCTPICRKVAMRKRAP